MSDNKNYKQALYTLVTVFFFWGFIAASNGVFIPFCKTYFSLDQFQSQLIDFAFYGAYYIGALFLFIFSSVRNTDIMNAWGFKSSIVNAGAPLEPGCHFQRALTVPQALPAFVKLDCHKLLMMLKNTCLQ